MKLLPHPNPNRPPGIVKYSVGNTSLQIYWPESNERPMFRIDDWMREEDIPELIDLLTKVVEELAEEH